MFCVDYVDGEVLRWTATDEGAICEPDPDYHPTLYVSAEPAGDLGTARDALTCQPTVEATAIEDHRRGFRHDAEPMLRVDVADLDAVTTVARQVRGWEPVGTYRCYDVDLSREFRYCLDTDTSPVPGRPLQRLSLTASDPQLASDALTELTVDGETVSGTPAGIVDAVDERVRAVDPDVLVLSSSAIVPQLFEQADKYDRPDFRLGRRDGYQQLAGRSTYTSYGQVGHSPARYNLPGRVIVDRSNTFMWNESNVAGCRYLVEQSWKPLQELGRSSIGSILTAIQIREARRRDVLVPWHSWRHEQFKSMRQLHAADRGGVTLSPQVGLHEDVHELDFASLYPNVIRTRNVSPETVRCDCCDTDDVPVLGYSICEDDGYLPSVLGPLIDHREEVKAELAETDDPERVEALEGESAAIKWILVACFGYQGFANAKYGRIECHESINAYAREILLTGKEILEANGWRLVHGIVDSLWVAADPDAEQTPLPDLCEEITEEAGIRLEYEGAFDWAAFVPRADSDAGALTKYFGKRADGDYKFRGIECRQRHTPTFVSDAQQDLIEHLDATRDPGAVCDRLRDWLSRLETGQVDPSDLVVEKRVSKRIEEYSQRTQSVAALKRARHLGVEKHPGESVEYVVANDETHGIDRVRLAFELDEGTSIDTDYYRTALVRAAASVLSPLDWRERDIERYLSPHQDASLGAFGG